MAGWGGYRRGGGVIEKLQINASTYWEGCQVLDHIVPRRADLSMSAGCMVIAFLSVWDSKAFGSKYDFMLTVQLLEKPHRFSTRRVLL